ncbi:hypothetical protein ACFOU0_12395 [Salinicoccus sesuvii]|uniref:SinR-like protein n=1 Tax=Salinicoccus sesuvii TaxID=868281 RepID=A0ABV7N8C7_9STAP
MGKPYLITYDLKSPSPKYEEVISTIKETLATSGWCSYWRSSFLIKSRYTPDQMLEMLKPYINSGDRFLIIEVVNNKQGWLTEKQWKFINENIVD